MQTLLDVVRSSQLCIKLDTKPSRLSGSYTDCRPWNPGFDYRVRLPGDKIFKLRLHQDPESLQTKFVRQVSRLSPGVVNSLGIPVVVAPAQQKRWNHPKSTNMDGKFWDCAVNHYYRWKGKRKMPHEILLRDSESRSTGSRFWCNLNLKILFPGSWTRDFMVDSQYNYRYAAKALYQVVTVDSQYDYRYAAKALYQAWYKAFAA